MKKIVALLLALVMTLSLGTVAFAKTETTQGKAEQAAIFVANVASTLLQYPAKYVASEIDKAGVQVANAVDEVCEEINNTVGQALTAVQNTMNMALRVVGAAEDMVKFAENFSWLLSWFGMEDSLTELRTIVGNIRNYTGPIFTAELNLGEFLSWIGAPAAEDGATQDTVAGQYVLDKFAEAVGFLTTAENFTAGVAEEGPVASFLYDVMAYYYTHYIMPIPAND